MESAKFAFAGKKVAKCAKSNALLSEDRAKGFLEAKERNAYGESATRNPQISSRSSRVVRASDSQSRSRKCPGFDPSIFRHSLIWGAADETVLNKVLLRYIKISLLESNLQWELRRNYRTYLRDFAVFLLCRGRRDFVDVYKILGTKVCFDKKKKIINIPRSRKSNFTPTGTKKPCCGSAMVIMRIRIQLFFISMRIHAEPDPGSQTNADTCGYGSWLDFKRKKR